MKKGTVKQTANDRPALVIRSPQDAVVAVPYLLGFHPANSLVALPFGDPALQRGPGVSAGRGPTVLRVDLIDPGQAARYLDAWCRQLVLAIAVGGSSVVLLTYTDDADLAEKVVDRMQRRLSEHAVQVIEAVRVAGSRWWSLTCADERCCPPDGVAFDPSTSLIAAQATFGGHSAVESREALADELRPLAGPDDPGLTAVFERAMVDLCTDLLVDGADVVTRRDAALVRDTLRRWRSGLTPLPDADLARLAVRVSRLPVRDEAWRMIRDQWIPTHRSLWAEVVRRALPPYDVAPACLLAVAAYVQGDGALARIALDRALDRTPDYSMALLLHEALDRVVPPIAMREMIESWDGDEIAEVESGD